MRKKRKQKKQEPGEVAIHIGGNASGQIAVGNNIEQSQTKIMQSITADEVEKLRQLFVKLEKEVETDVTPDKKDAAREQVIKLEQAVVKEKPDLRTMERVKNWFGKNAPALLGTVASVIVNPIVGKLVAAGGDLLVEEFNRKFRDDPEL